VAKKIVELSEDPKRSYFMGRVYDVPAITNTLFPGLIDRVSIAWVKKERRKELQQGRRRQGSNTSLLPLLRWTTLGALGALFISWWVRKKSSTGL
jgi:hypothetical protein